MTVLLRPDMVAGLMDRQLPLRHCDNRWEIDADVVEAGPVACDVCTKDMLRHGKRVAIYADVPWCGQAVRIHVRFSRYRCVHCGVTRPSIAAGLAAKRNVTDRLISYVQEQVPLQSVTAVALNLGLDEKTIRNIAHENMPLFLDARGHRGVRILGILSYAAAANRYTIFVDVADRRVLDVIKTDSARAVQTWLDKLENKSMIHAVVTDMVRTFRLAASNSLPDARLFADPNLVEQVIRDHVASTWGRKKGSKRQRLPSGAKLLTKRELNLGLTGRNLLDRMIARNPLLNRAWVCKERLLRIWDEGQDRALAANEMASWRASVSPEIAREFSPLIRLVDDWGPLLIASIGIDMLEGYSLARTRLLSTIGRDDLRFDRFRAKVLSASPIFKDALDICDSCLRAWVRMDMCRAPHISAFRPDASVSNSGSKPFGFVICKACNESFEHHNIRMAVC